MQDDSVAFLNLHAANCDAEGLARPAERFRKAADEITALRAENGKLRQIISSLGYCTPDASLEFMGLVPAEIAARIDKMIADLDALTRNRG